VAVLDFHTSSMLVSVALVPTAQIPGRREQGPTTASESRSRRCIAVGADTWVSGRVSPRWPTSDPGGIVERKILPPNASGISPLSREACSPQAHCGEVGHRERCTPYAALDRFLETASTRTATRW
jgi:hypothetical protein